MSDPTAYGNVRGGGGGGLHWAAAAHAHLQERVYCRLSLWSHAVDGERVRVQVHRLLEREGDEGSVVQLHELRQLRELLALLRHTPSHVPRGAQHGQVEEIGPF